MPTILELLGIPVPNTVEGKGLSTFIVNGQKGEKKGEENADEPEHAFLCMMPGMPELVAPTGNWVWNRGPLAGEESEPKPIHISLTGAARRGRRQSVFSMTMRMIRIRCSPERSAKEIRRLHTGTAL